MWTNTKEKLPLTSDEYLVVWDLDDGGKPVVTSMDFDTKRRCWIDPRGIKKPITNKVLFWMELPSAPLLNEKIRVRKKKHMVPVIRKFNHHSMD